MRFLDILSEEFKSVDGIGKDTIDKIKRISKNLILLQILLSRISEKNQSGSSTPNQVSYINS